MMGRISEYAIVRFVPEAFRGELINIGIVVLKTDAFDLRLYPQPIVFKALGVDPTVVELLPTLLEKLDEPDAPNRERWQLLSRMPGFELSQQGWLSYDSDEEYELRLNRIRQDYIDRPKHAKIRKRSTGLTRQLKEVFREYQILGRVAEDISRHKVVSNWAVGPSGKLHVDFLVKNGVYHATETADFRLAHDIGTAELKEAALAAVTLQCARSALGPVSTRCYLVYSASSLVEKAVSPALEIAEPTVDRMFNLESGDQRRDYFDLILAAAGSPSLFRSN